MARSAHESIMTATFLFPGYYWTEMSQLKLSLDVGSSSKVHHTSPQNVYSAEGVVIERGTYGCCSWRTSPHSYYS